MNEQFRLNGLRRWRDRLLRAALLLSVIFQAPAASGARDSSHDARDAYSALSEELSDCFSYARIAAQCARNSDRSDMALVADKMADLVIALVYQTGKLGGASDEAMTSRLHLSMKSLPDRANHNCVNLDSLIDDYGLACKSIIQHPSERLSKILKSLRDGRQPRWPFQPGK